MFIFIVSIYFRLLFDECYAGCRLTKAGKAYNGAVSTTSSGKQCQYWSSSTPHVQNSNYTDTDFPDGSILLAENFCRNPEPNWHDGVWCYTMDPDVRWEPCDVPMCCKSSIINFAQSFHIGII